ncbi:GTP binding (Bud4) [Cordyceps militaris]|uniref:GTP binding (Bud4) n=1 Tax=Cordyceps militaris TaxID=73501 RepID=A0A2H4SPT6_CORMI|nr:GTP binding (Bud4) [Cordyceps militaris]
MGGRRARIPGLDFRPPLVEVNSPSVFSTATFPFHLQRDGSYPGRLVHPLRIAKGTTTPRSSPTKMAGGLPRPLSELSPTERRRNSPSWHQIVSPKVCGMLPPPPFDPVALTRPLLVQKPTLGNDSSPFQSSPLDGGSSPRHFWQNRNSENVPYGGGHAATSPSPQRRSSIERLQRASRVKNSNILALEQKQEYDPTRIPTIERPLAKVQVNSLGLSSSSSASFSGGLRSFDSEYQIPEFKRSDTASTTSSFFSTMSTNTAIGPIAAPTTPRANRDQPSNSPTKSSLSPSKFKDSFDPVTGTWSTRTSYIDDDFSSSRSSHRHVKSVTFDAAPPQINEYEMTTPDLSSIGTNSREGSYESDDTDGDRGYYDLAHGQNPEDSFDASLEDTMKTPVVGPDDYSPYGRGHGRFEASPMPDGSPSMALSNGFKNKNVPSSVSSSAEHRPLPPVPNRGHERIKSSDSSSGMSATTEHMINSGQRNLPTPPPGSASSSDTQSFGHSKMPLEERLKLMMMSDDGDAKSAAEQQRERRLRRGSARERINSPAAEELKLQALEDAEADDTIGDMSALGDFHMPAKISRESILRRVNGNKVTERESDFNLSSPAQSPCRSPERTFDVSVIPEDPDIPIPSTEDSMVEDESIVEDETIVEDGSVIITRNPSDYGNEVVDLYEDEDDFSILPDDDTYEEVLVQAQQAEEVTIAQETPQLVTPREPALTIEPTSPQPEAVAEPQEPIPALPSPTKRAATPEKSLSKSAYDGSGWGDDDEFADEPESPGSVIRHPVDDEDVFEEERVESPAIPEQVATIKASGSKLKTRISNTPADIGSMREARRLASQEVPNVPPIPEKHKNRLSKDMAVQLADGEDPFIERHPSFKNRSLTLDLDTGLSLDKDFERVIEGQKRGYLMRQNTKLVAASDKEGEDMTRKTRSVNNSPIKNDRPQSWTVEPWNPAVRKKSTSSKATTASTGSIPPLPGQESNSIPTRSIPEEDMSMDATTLDGAERGRLFVKVMGVKDLDLPLPRNERTWFSLTLDNGVHCVTTSWLELARNAPIGQEFELVVPNDLEFQLTLNVKLEKPAYLDIPVPVKPVKSKTSAFSKVFASPKKRKEMELRQREEERVAKQHQEALARQKNGTPSAYELLSPLVAEVDGSFARSYVCLKEHENRCYGRPYMAEVVCFNEWAQEEEAFACSVKSKRGTGAVVRRAPYNIGKLELQLLFVPRPKNITDDDMPKSMNSCIRELRAAEERLARSWEGPLSQQGGDCPYWRRRYFKLMGARLTAYHEATRQPRATINLSNAKRLIDDRRTLMEKETTVKGGKRRRSAFAEEEDGYMFVEEGFRIRFNNGEVIDFYADTAEDKEGWMKVLQEVIGRSASSIEDDGGPRSRAKWCDVVLKREELLRRRAERKSSHSRTKSGQSSGAPF